MKKAIITKAVIAVVCGVTALPMGTARANDIEDFFKKAHKTIVKANKDILTAHVAAATVAATLAPRVGSVNVRVGAVQPSVRVRIEPNRTHECALVRVKVWVPGTWQESVEQRWISYGNRPGGYYGDVVVRYWVPGYYEYRLEPDPNCWCQRTGYAPGTRHDRRPTTYCRPRRDDHDRNDRNDHRDGRRR